MIKAFTLGLIMGAVIGTAFGVLIMACVQAGKDDDYMANKISHAKDPDRVNKMKVMSEVKLKPCPFCGYGKPIIEDNSTEDFPGDWIIQCNGCGTAFIASNDGLPCTKSDLIDRWNRRTAANPSEINENAPNSGENNLGE